MASSAYPSYVLRSLRSPRQSSAWARSVSALVVLGLMACTFSASAQTAHFGGTITTLTGSFQQPFGIAVDPSGNVFVADSNNNAIYEMMAVGGVLPSSPTINRLAQANGNFNGPQGLALDASGNLFVADGGHNVVKKILAAGGYTTVSTLGSGFSTPVGVAVDSNGNVFVADTGNNAVKEILAAGGYATVNTLNNSLSSPFAVAVDANSNVYVTDSGNNSVKKILAAGGYTTVSVVGSGFNNPQGITVDKNGNVFIADTANGMVKEVLATGGYTTITTLGSGFYIPEGVAVDNSGNVFVADTYNSLVKKIEATSENFGSSAIATATPVTLPLTFTFDTSGTILAPSVLTQGATGLDFTNAGTGTCAAGTYSAAATCTVNVTFIPKAPGVRYGAATLKNTSGTVIATAYVYGTGIGPQAAFSPASQITLGSGFSSPFAVAVDAGGNIFVADFANSQIKEILAAGGYTTINILGSGFLQPAALAVDGSGNVFVADYGHGAVKEILAAGGYSTVLTLGTGFSSPLGIAVDGSGNVFVALTMSNMVQELLAAGGYSTVLTLGSGFTTPRGIVVDNDGNVFVGCLSSVQEILARGGYTTVNTLGSGQFSNVFSVALDANSNVFVGDTSHNAVKEILAAGGYTTVNTLGSGFSLPRGVFVDGRGNVYIADTAHNAIKELDYADPPSLSFASTAVGATSSDSPKTVTLANSGNATLTFPTPTSGLNPAIGAGFTLGNSSTCPQLSTSSSSATLAVGASCTNLISFSPASAGSINSALTITDDALNAPAPTYTTQSLALSGTATGGTPTIAFTVPAHTYGDAPFTVAATSNSTGAFTYTVVSGPATLSGSTVTLTGTGTVVLRASEASDSSYASATQNATFTVVAATPTISFAVPNHTYGDAHFTVSAVSNSTGVFTYSVVSGPATLSGATVTLTGAGTVVLQATEASDSNYVSSTRNATFTVAAGTPTLTFSVPNHTYGDAPFTVSATSNSTGALTYTVVSGPATVSGATVTLTGAGTVVIQASEAADSSYGTGTGNATFTVAAAAPAISLALSNHTYGDTPFVVAATSNSAGTLAYTVVSGPATISGATITLIGAGTVVVQAAQTATANYLAANTTATFTVAAGTPTLTFAIPNHTYGDLPFGVAATSNSAGILTYTVVSGPATISGATVTLTGAGTVTLQAIQAASTNFVAATATTTFIINAGTPTITFAVSNHTYGDPPFAISATSNSPGTFTYTVVSGPATVTGSTVTLTGSGTVNLRASQAASGNYGAASTTTTFAIAANSTTITFVVPSHIYGDLPFAVSATSNSNAPFSYTVVSGPATIAGSTVTLTGAGTVVLQALQAANANYSAGSSTAAFVVAPASPALLFAVPNHVYGDVAFTVGATSNSPALLTYTVVSGPATLSGATVTLTSAGLVTLRAAQAATANYAAANATTTFLVTASFALSSGSSGSASTQTIPTGTAAAFTLMFTPAGGTYINPLQLSVTGLPPGATATFFPAVIPAGAPSTSITLIVQTATQTSRHEDLGSTLIPVAVAFVLMPLVGLKSLRKRMRHLPAILSLIILSLAATLGLSGCGSTNNAAPGKSYPLVITATDTVTGTHTATTVTLVLQ